MNKCLQLTIWACLCATLASGGPTPAWSRPEFENRAVFTVPGEVTGSLIVTLPCNGLKLPPAGPAVVALDSAGAVVSAAVVHYSGTDADVLVKAPAPGNGTLCVYFGPPPASVAAAAPFAPLRAENPVTLEVYRPGGISTTNSWDKMFYLYRKARVPTAVSVRPGFGAIPLFDDEDQDDGRKRRQSRLWIAVLKTSVFCPQSGAYQFAVDSAEAAWALVDGEMAVTAAAREGGPVTGEARWQRGPALQLKAGVHELEVFCFVLRKLSLRVGWELPDGEAIVPIPDAALLAAWKAENVRLESKTRSLHPNFSCDLEQAYAFRGAPGVFVPVRLTNTTVNWVAGDMTCRWRFADGTTAEGTSLRHVFPGAGLHPVTLEVTDALGFVASTSRTINCRLVQAEEYALDGDITGLDAVYYPHDVVQPVLRLSGRTPPDAALEVWWKVKLRNGVVREHQQKISVSTEPLWLTVLREEAGALAEFHWAVRDYGVDVLRETVRFQSPPFHELPTGVDGDHLVDSTGAHVVLIPAPPPENQPLQPPINLRQAPSRVLCVDDLLVPAGSTDDAGKTFDRGLGEHLDASPPPIVTLVRLPAWDSRPNAYGPLLKFISVPELIEPDTGVVVLSLGMPDLLVTRDPAQFERHLAALVDLVTGTLKHSVVLVTPPPFPSDPEGIRPYAAGIRRVADSRNLPVADLFTAFLGLRESSTRSFFRAGNDLALSPSGQALAAQVIAHALTAGPGEER